MTDKKKEGQYMTPDGIVSMILNNIGYTENHVLTRKIMEPSFGDGAFLINIVQRIISEGTKIGLSKQQITDIMQVIGFPNGYNTTAVKVYETKDAIKNGASEIDMVINIGMLKDKKYDDIKKEIRAIHEACDGKVLKVIIETCLLTEEEKITMCKIVTAAGAEYIKTSTGFSTAGATPEDIVLMKNHVGPNVKIKAAGGVKDFLDAELMINLGADRLGTSRLVRALKAKEN